MHILTLLAITFVGMVIVVGGYVFMFLNVMRADPREREFRKQMGQKNTLIPHRYKDEKK